MNATDPCASVGLATPLLARLEMVRPAGAGRWYARCPAHDDKTPSLSVREADSRVLIHCHAGCDASDVLAAVGLAWAALYPDRWDCARLRPNKGAVRYARKALAAADPLDHERQILRIALADIETGKILSVEDHARAEIAMERVVAAGGRSSC